MKKIISSIIGVWLLLFFVCSQAYGTPMGDVVLTDVINLNSLAGTSVGITYDSTDDSLWLTNSKGTNGTVYVTDVIQISQDGAELARFAAPESAFAYRGITMSSDASTLHLIGDVWDHGEVFSFSKDGTLIGRTSLIGANLATASGIAISDDGDIWVSDFDGAELFKFSSDGYLQNSFNLSFTPGNIALDSDNGNLYIMPLSDPYIHVLNISDLTEFNIPIPPRDTSIGLGLRSGLAVSPNNIYALDTGWNHIEVYSSAPVPEPSTILLMGIGLLGLVGIKARKKRS